MADTIEQQKQIAAEAAVNLIEDGIVLGMGTGSTVDYAIRALGNRVRKGLRVLCVPTSQATKALLEQENISTRPISDLSQTFWPDLYIDGADEIDPALNLIKGKGGALLREKIVADASRRFIVIADESKVVSHLGIKGVLPVEVLPDAAGYVRARLLESFKDVIYRHPFVTENGNVILDCHPGGAILDPAELESALNNIPGVFENGIFAGRTAAAIIGTDTGPSWMTP